MTEARKCVHMKWLLAHSSAIFLAILHGFTLNSTYNEVAFNEKLPITKENLCTKYTPFTYEHIALNEKLPITKQNLHIFFFIIGRVECSWNLDWLKAQVFAIPCVNFLSVGQQFQNEHFYHYRSSGKQGWVMHGEWINLQLLGSLIYWWYNVDHLQILSFHLHFKSLISFRSYLYTFPCKSVSLSCPACMWQFQSTVIVQL